MFQIYTLKPNVDGHYTNASFHKKGIKLSDYLHFLSRKSQIVQHEKSKMDGRPIVWNGHCTLKHKVPERTFDRYEKLSHIHRIFITGSLVIMIAVIVLFFMVVYFWVQK